MNWDTFQHKVRVHLTNQGRWFWVFHLVIVLGLSIGFTAAIWNDHAFGAWGDDSPGYTYLASRLLHDQPLVYQDPLVQHGLDFFGNEKAARWLTPTHHDIISPDGWLASVYPVGLSFLMWLAAMVAGTDLAFYVVVPVAAGVCVGLTYLLGIVVLHKNRFRTPIAFAAAIALGSSQLFFEMAVSQPMREIPSMVFVLLSVMCAVKAYRHTPVWWLLSGLSLGLATNVRETSIILILALMPLLLPKQLKNGFKSILQGVWRPAVLLLVGFLLAYSLSLWNSVEISQHKVKFKKRDLTSVALTSNIDHIQSLSWSNIFNNQGKFETGTGSLPHYWKVLRNATSVVFLFPLVLFGLWSMWKTDKRLFWCVLLWPVGTLAVFSLWVNPYARYILPSFPPLMLLAFVGCEVFLRQWLPKVVGPKRLRWVISGLCLFAVATPFYYTLKQEVRDIREKELLIYKSISQSDLLALKELGQLITTPKPVVLFTGTWQYGISETLELHTQVKAVRFPLENKRFDLSQDQVFQFLQRLVSQGYTIYVWTDETTPSQTQSFLSEHFSRTRITTSTSSYAEQISVDQLMIP